MGFRINNNITALVATGNLMKTNRNLATSIERLSSGLRINRGADDAAGLTISEKLRGQIKGLNRAATNAQDGISLIQTAEGALNEDASMLNRLRELAIQSQADSLTTNDRLEIQKEVDQLVDEIDRVALTTEFNTKKLLDGTASSLVSTNSNDLKAFQVGNASQAAGDYNVSVNLSQTGTKQIQKSGILKNNNNGNIAGLSTRLNDLSSVIDNSGNNILESPTNLTIRANGKKVDITVSGDMTIERFTSTVESALTKSENDGGLGLTGSTFALDIKTGQMIFESSRDGFSGEISLSADENLLKAFAFQITTESVAAAYSVSATTTGIANPTTQSTSTTTDRAQGIIEGVDIKFNLASEARVDGSIAAQEVIQVGTVDIIFTIHDTNGGNAQQANLNSTNGVTVRLTANRSFSLASISSIVNLSAQGANSTTNAFRSYGSGAVAGSMGVPGITASFDGYNLKLTSSVGGSSGSLSILASQSATDLLGIQSGKTLGTGGTSAVIAGSTDVSAGVTLAGVAAATNVLRIRIYDGDFRSTAVGGNTLPQVTDDILFNRGEAISSTSIVDTFNNSFSANGLDIVATINSSGQLEFRSGETGGDAKISIAAIGAAGGMSNLGLVANQNSVGNGGNAAIYTGNTTSSAATTGYVMSAISTFSIQDQFGSSSGQIALGAVGVGQTNGNMKTDSFAVSQEQITSVITASNLSSTDIGFSFDAGGRLDFTSRSIGESSRIVLTQNSASDSSASLNSLGLSVNQAVQGSGDTKFKLHVTDRTLNFQIGANQSQALGFEIINTTAEALGIKGLDITNIKAATRALGRIDKAVQIISSERSKLGSLQNRLTSTINNLTVTSTNLQATESKIRDVDVAKETVNFTRNQILIQAGTAQLAQAKGLPQNALQLLQ
ncbi:MAG: hypothetical protein COB02_09815 [Candidatus Cloacimonadota bacterium]|nr:MAG: hypothetical protein COB02_09815 [Candidatus Cloacimonadota bacterium]